MHTSCAAQRARSGISLIAPCMGLNGIHGKDCYRIQEGGFLHSKEKNNHSQEQQKKKGDIRVLDVNGGILHF